MRGLRQGICVVAVAFAVGAAVLATAVAWEDSSIAKLASLALTAVVLVVAGGLGVITTEPADLSLAGRVAKGLGLWGGESTRRTAIVTASSFGVATLSWSLFGGAMLHVQVDCNEAKSLSWDEWIRPPDPVECRTTPQAVNAWRPFTSEDRFVEDQLLCNFAGTDGGPIVRRHPVEEKDPASLPICLREPVHPSTLLSTLPPVVEDAGVPDEGGLPLADAARIDAATADATPPPDAAPPPVVRSVAMTRGTGFLVDEGKTTSVPGTARHLWWNGVQLVPAHDVLVAKSDGSHGVDRKAFEAARTLVPKAGDRYVFLLPTRPPTAVAVRVDGVGSELHLTYEYPVPVR